MRFSAVVLVLAGCSPAYADRIGPAPGAGKAIVARPAPPPAESPYSVDLIGENGSTLQTYQHNGRFYVLGQVGQRYTIRVGNPTDRRVEAVLSVDGLDVIDGKTADYVNKRGYIVPPRGELRVEGFRVSTSHVATFRFSSVAASYAGRKGQPRNVGVIGVAIFEEKAQPQIVAPVVVDQPRPRPTPRDYYWDDLDEGSADFGGGYRGAPNKDVSRTRTANAEEREAPAEPAPPPAADRAPAPTGGTVTGSAGGGAPAPRQERYVERKKVDTECCGAKPKARPGLGTEFGENRYSAVSFTRFERANQTKPTAMAELRYNDRDGLVALGIRLGPVVDQDEISTRETADPFPNSPYSEPPIGWR